MGTDIYLAWNKMSKSEKDEQYSGWSINGGDTGYLRASIGMTQENQLLRLVFPRKYWEGGKKVRFIFDQKSLARCGVAGRMYLAHAIMGTRMKEEELPNKGMLESILKALTGQDFDKVTVGGMNDQDLFGKVTWIKSLFDFFEKGYEKEEKKLKPTVYISW